MNARGADVWERVGQWETGDSDRWAALARLSVDLADIDDLDQLGAAYHAGVGRVVDLPMRAIYLFGDAGDRPAWTTSDGVSERFMTTYERIGRPVDLELREVLRTAAPVYNLAFRTVEQWRGSEVYQLASRIERMAHVIKAPVVVHGAVIGTIDFATSDEDAEVRQVDVDLATALASVVGGAIVGLRRRERVEAELDTVQTALDGSSAAVVWFDADTHEPRATAAAAALVDGLQEGTDILHRILYDDAPDGRESSRSYLVRLRDGSRDVLECRVRPVPGRPGHEVVELALETAETHAVHRALEGLSARELDVAALVAVARSDREIAEELVLSLHTVRQHVKNIYLKLGISSRVELTRVVLGRTPRAS